MVFPCGSMNTTAWPLGRLQVASDGCTAPEGRETFVPTPRTSRPARTTRSPRGPHSNRPGSVTLNRQVRPEPSGATAHALPSAAKVIVADGEGTAWSQPAGSEAISATGSVDGVVTDGEGPGGVVVPGLSLG